MGLFIQFLFCGATILINTFQWTVAFIIFKTLPISVSLYVVNIFAFMVIAGRQYYEGVHDQYPEGMKLILLVSTVKIHMLSVQLYDQDRIKKGKD